MTGCVPERADERLRSGPNVAALRRQQDLELWLRCRARSCLSFLPLGGGKRICRRVSSVYVMCIVGISVFCLRSAIPRGEPVENRGVVLVKVGGVGRPSRLTERLPSGGQLATREDQTTFYSKSLPVLNIPCWH